MALLSAKEADVTDRDAATRYAEAARPALMLAIKAS